ncbi:helix-turn-helix domain-containing protein [Burkholderia stabilis]|uniref:helix-turn-helix domain-containing protein n=1 Tax=Burkholderia stabilis TaxID=95485 RepID=UPI00080B34F5|nr:helix-turn-helix domain-containing protein [Burkholderia stabilis]GAU07017.1 toxin-antitoxin system, antitoxin component, Xre family [Burkholderia stabilis]
MQHMIEQASGLGGAIRAARKVRKWSQNDAAGRLGVSESFMVKAECSADAVQWGNVFQVLPVLDVRIIIDLPDASGAPVERESARASRRAEIRASRAACKETSHD